MSWLLILLGCSTLAQGASIPDKDSAAELSLNPQITRLGSPGPFRPPLTSNYKVEINWHDGERLNPWAVYYVANHMMYVLSLHDWSDPISQEARMAQDNQGRAGIVITNDSPNRTLKTEYAVRALYEVIHRMATQQPGFFGAKLSILVSQRPIATILMYNPRFASMGEDKASNDTTASLLSNSTAFTNDLRALAAPINLTSISGEIIEPEDPRFRITYTYDDINVPVQDIAFAFFDGLAQSAQLDHTAPCSYIDGVSASSNFVMHLGGGGDSGTTLWAWQAKRALFLLFYELYAEKRVFKGVDFAVLWNGKTIANGFMLKMSPVGEINGTNASISTA
ncbi:hypothetical protein ACLMJK_000010 [Lecanora helva]